MLELAIIFGVKKNSIYKIFESLVLNRNEITGTVIDNTLGYAVQGFVYSGVINAINLSSTLLIKISKKYSIRLIVNTFNKYVKKQTLVTK
mgnify:CR=1 FL=1